jgi:serine/threonine-protein kinase
MAGTTSRYVPIAIGTASDTEEGRSFFQERLGLFGGCVFLISGGFYVLDLILRAIASQVVVRLPLLFGAPMLLHLAGTLVAGAVWAGCQRLTFAFPTLRRLDAIVTVVLAASFSLMSGAIAVTDPGSLQAVDPRHAISVGLMACSYVVLSRAIALPSAPGRTAWISAAAMLPIVATNAYVLNRSGIGRGTIAFAIVDVAAWGAAATTLAAISSRVIFGLRAEMAKVRRLGQYTLEEKIGEGGMGVVYRANHAMLRRPTAIKLLPPEKVGEDSLRRFEREVQLTARLTHPNTVAIFDYGRTPDGIFYYAMEFLDGLNLDQLVREDGPQRPGRVIHLLEQVCGALAEAHGIGLVHRDIKPANILLVDRGGVPDVVKVVDFGLVKHIDPMGTEATLTVTAGNLVRGTPLYMPPEAITGDQALDARSDLYAVGMVGYFLLTGKPVFEGASIVEILAHQLHTDPPPPSSRVAQPISAALEALLLQCLAKDPKRRPADALSLKRALERCAGDAPWSSDAAAVWWEAYRRRHGTARVGPGREADLPTLAVDVRERVATHHAG